MRLTVRRKKLAALLGQVGQDRAALEQRLDAIFQIVIDDRWNFIVERNGEECRIELLVRRDVDGFDLVR